MADRRVGHRRGRWRRQVRLQPVSEIERAEPGGKADGRDGVPMIEAAGGPDVGPVVLVHGPFFHWDLLRPAVALLPLRQRPRPVVSAGRGCQSRYALAIDDVAAAVLRPGRLFVAARL